MIVAVFVIFSLFRGLTHRRKPITNNNLTSSTSVTAVAVPGTISNGNRGNHRLNDGTIGEPNLNSSFEELCVSMQSDTVYSTATSKIYDKRRQDSSSICSDIFNTDEGRSVAEETRITTRKSLTRIRRCMSRTSLSRRRRTTGRYGGSDEVRFRVKVNCECVFQMF